MSPVLETAATTRGPLECPAREVSVRGQHSAEGALRAVKPAFCVASSIFTNWF